MAVPTIASFVLLMLLVTAYNAATLLRDAAYSRIPSEYLLSLVMLRNVTAAEVLLPTALYMAILATLNRVHREREAFAAYAAGASPGRASAAAALWCLLICLGVSALSLFARPWAYGESYRIDRSIAQLSTSAMVPDRFYSFGSAAVLMARDIDTKGGVMTGVFMENRLKHAVRIVTANSGRIDLESTGDRRRLELRDGTSHWISETTRADRVSEFTRLVYFAPPEESGYITNQRRALPTRALFEAERPKEIAELQWRFVLPLTALFLTLIAIEIARSMPGASPYPRFVAALIVYAAIFNVVAVARTWLENGRVDTLPGMLWVPIAAAVVWLLLRQQPRLSLRAPQ